MRFNLNKALIFSIFAISLQVHATPKPSTSSILSTEFNACLIQFNNLGNLSKFQTCKQNVFDEFREKTVALISAFSEKKYADWSIKNTALRDQFDKCSKEAVITQVNATIQSDLVMCEYQLHTALYREARAPF